MNPISFRSFLGAAAMAAILAPASAQLVQNLALANGTHVWGSPYWTENVADGNAEAGVVDHLNNVFWLELHSPQVTLQPGTYVAQAKVAKMTGTSGAYDLTVRVHAGASVLGSTVLPVAAQTLNTYVWSKEVLFTITQPTAVDVAVWNTSNIQNKTNYRFDTARIGRVPVGPVLQHTSLDTWSIANDSFFDHYVAEPTGTYGRTIRRNGLWGLTWLDLSKAYALSAGVHKATVRFRNLNGMPYAEDMYLEAYDSQANLLGSVVVPAAAQLAGQWVQSADLTITLPAADTVTFSVNNHGLNVAFGGGGYEFDSFALRQVTPSFTTYGAACGGITLSQPVAAQVGLNTTFTIGNGGAALVGAFAFGNPVAPVPLDFLGATGCLLHVTPDVLSSGLFSGGSCSVVIAVPNLPTMFGLTLDLQGAALDANAPGGLKTSNAGRAYIGL